MISIGSLALPAAPLILFAALLVSVFVGKRLAVSHKAKIDSALYNVMLAGVVSARLAFVVRHWDKYRQSVMAMIDIRDGGFLPWVGLGIAAAVAMLYLWRGSIPQRALLSALAAGMLVALVGGATVWMLRRPYTDIPLPSQVFVTPDGRGLRLDAFRGKPVVVNLWASWCPPCRHEMPVLQQAQAQYRDVVFVFADQGESMSDVTRFLGDKRLDIANVVLDADRSLARYVNSKGLPTTLFFDRSGRLADVRVGELSAASLDARLAGMRKEDRH